MAVYPANQENPKSSGNVLERFSSLRVPLTLETGLYAAIFLAALGLRFWDLGTRALHHDESIHAQWSWGLLQGNYHHSPIFHGPLYYHVQALVFLVFGANDYTSRVSAALFGMALVAMPFLLRKRLGQIGTMTAVALIAFSPTLVYYSRFFREDIYMGFFTVLSVVAIWRYMEDGRHRWLYTFAAGFTGSVLVKEGAFLTAALLLVYLNVYLAAQLATQTLQHRGNSTVMNRVALTLGLAPGAWLLAALWPFVGPIKRRMEWDELPRSGDLLVLLGTFVLPLLTPLSRKYLLEPFGIVEPGRLDWEKKLQGTVARQDILALAGLFAVTTSLAAFGGLQWKPKVWGTAFLLCGVVYLTLMTSFWTNTNGLISGPWGSLDYWAGQQNEHRGDQPWFYYYMVMAMYEFLPLLLCFVGVWWAIARGDAFARFLVTWLAGIWLILSWTSEKMPWNNVHIALPACFLAAWAVQKAWDRWQRRPFAPKAAMTLGSVALSAAGAMAIIAFLPGGPLFLAVRLVALAILIAETVYVIRPFGRTALAPAIVAIIVGAFSLFSVRTMVMASFVRGDDPKDLLIYTQSSGQLADIARQINDLAEASGKGYRMPIAVDSSDSYAWPWAWYLRDYKSVSYIDFNRGLPPGEFDVILVNQSNLTVVMDQMANSGETRFGSPVRYPHRWWYEEDYKAAMNVGDGTCLTKSGNCGPFRLATWKHIASGVSHGWLEIWAKYWRDHDPHQPNGSTDANAFFPANYDFKTKKLLAQPVDVPRPTADKAGRPSIGAIGGLPGQFMAPVDVETDAAGNIYVIDSRTKRLQKFDRDGNSLASVDIRAGTADQSEPWGLAISPQGTVFVADTFGWRIRVFDKDLKPVKVFGTTPDPSKAPGPTDLFGPRDIIVDDVGNIWVTDTGNDRIQVFTATGDFVKSVGGSGSGQGQFDEPVGLSRASDGTIFVADMLNKRVVLLNPDGSFKSQFTVDGWGGNEVTNKPYLEALQDGRIAVGLPLLNQVRIYERSGRLASTIAPQDDPLNRPYGIAQIADGRLWIVDGGANRLRLFTLP